MKKFVLVNSFIILILSCSSTIDYKNVKNTSNTRISLPSSNEIIEIENRMKDLKRKQDKILLTGTMEEIDRVILENELLRSYENWKGTKYLWGGDSKKGIDCSALTRRVYREVFGYELPRVAKDQANHGRKISTSQLKPGDILFFRPEERVNHTAVYLGNTLFINASTSQGVVISSLESKYWGKYFKYAVRIDKI